MIGHLPLLALRRKGLKPRRGVRIDLGCIDPLMARHWHGPRLSTGRAVVWVCEEDEPADLDLRFVRGLDVVLAVSTANPRERIDAAIERVAEASPALLDVVLLDRNNDWIDGLRFAGFGQPWIEVNERQVRLWN